MHGNRELMVYQPRLIQRFMRTGIWRPHVSETVSLLHGPSLYNTKSYVHSLGFWSAGRVTACAIIWWNQTLYASRLKRDNAIMSRKLLRHSLDFWSVWETRGMRECLVGISTWPVPEGNNDICPTHYNGCNYLSMLGLKLNHVSKRGHLWRLFCSVYIPYVYTYWAFDHNAHTDTGTLLRLWLNLWLRNPFIQGRCWFFSYIIIENCGSGNLQDSKRNGS